MARIKHRLWIAGALLGFGLSGFANDLAPVSDGSLFITESNRTETVEPSSETKVAEATETETTTNAHRDLGDLLGRRNNPSPAPESEKSADSDTMPAPFGRPTGNGLRPALAALLLLGLLVGINWRLRRRAKEMRVNGAVAEGIRILESRPLDHRRRLLLVEADGRRALLCVGRDSAFSVATYETRQEAHDVAQDEKITHRESSSPTAVPAKSIPAGRILLGIGLFTLCLAGPARAQAPASPALAPAGVRIQFDAGESPAEMSRSIQLLLIITALSLVPSAIIMMTSFTRLIIVFGFMRQALGTQQSPPGRILTALSLFLTIFIMAPVFGKINDDALKPYLEETITQGEAWERGLVPLRQFMTSQTGEKELILFLDLAKKPTPENVDEITLDVLIPAFMLSELKTAFQMGFLIYLPFLVIDLVIASSLMSLGMMMLPPMMISIPIKILFFVLADGWTLLVRGLVTSFAT